MFDELEAGLGFIFTTEIRGLWSDTRRAPEKFN